MKPPSFDDESTFRRHLGTLNGVASLLRILEANLTFTDDRYSAGKLAGHVEAAVEGMTTLLDGAAAGLARLRAEADAVAAEEGGPEL